MEASEQLEVFRDFLETYYSKEIGEAYTKGKSDLKIDFHHIAEFNPDLAEQILNQPEEAIRAAEIVSENFNIENTHRKELNIRIINLPESARTIPKKLEIGQQGQFISVKGRISAIGETLAQIYAAKFECPSCGNIINVLQLSKKMKMPSQCSCGRKGKFRKISLDIKPMRTLVIEDLAEDVVEGYNFRRISCLLTNSLAQPENEKYVMPGKAIILNGILKLIPYKNEEDSAILDMLLEVNSIEIIEQEDSVINLSPEDIEEITALAKEKNVLEKLARSVVPSQILDLSMLKSTVLQLIGCPKKKNRRSEFHILLCGEPGTGKSVFGKEWVHMALRGRYTSCTGASAKGLTATVEKDDLLGGKWVVRAGPMVLLSGGHLCLDEFQEVDEEEQGIFNEAMSEGEHHVNRAGVNATLKADASLLAISNPIYGTFDPNIPISKQLGLKPALQSRFDFVWIIRDIPNEEEDRQIMRKMIGAHKAADDNEGRVVSKELFKKYLTYVKKFDPQHTPEADALLEVKFLEFRKLDSGEEKTQVSRRYGEALIRVSESISRAKLKNMGREEVDEAYKLLMDQIQNRAMNPITGKIELSEINPEAQARQRKGKPNIIMQFIYDLTAVSKKNGNNGIVNYEDIIMLAQERSITEFELQNIIEKLEKEGDIYEPKPGKIKLL